MLDLSQYTVEEIDNALIAVTEEFSHIAGIDMSRMQLQIDYAKKCLHAFHQGTQTIILSAPTGFGKSLMAFFISKVFSKLKPSSQSYIMTSNKFLQKQYHQDIQWLKFETFAMLQGQANYSCTENNKSFTERACTGESLSSLIEGKTQYACAKTCKYLIERQAAIVAETTILNYHYWLTALNLVYETNLKAAFQPRALSIFDECHTLGDIVQDMFTVEFNVNSFIRRTLNAFYVITARIHTTNTITASSFVKIADICRELQKHEDDAELSYKLIVALNNEIVELKVLYSEHIKTLTQSLPLNAAGKMIKTDEEESMIKYFQTLVTTYESIGNMLTLYDKFGKATMVVQSSQIDTRKNKRIDEFGDISLQVFKFQCTNESELVKQAVHKYTNYSIFMSATIGNADDWAIQVGIENYIAVNVPQVFDYTPSPINSVLPMISMSYHNKHMNMNEMVTRILRIVDAHKGQNGLIHTGNFQIAKALQERNHPRLYTYSNSLEKESMVDLLSNSQDIVIMGPSLIEGVDLKDDLCRFMIFAKVPYMSLGDKLTKRKMDIYKNWYNWSTMSSFLQGLGRSVRNTDDWCKTYLLDSGFESFFKRYAPPNWVSTRMNYVQSTNVLEVFDPEKEFNDIMDSL